MQVHGHAAVTTPFTASSRSLTFPQVRLPPIAFSAGTPALQVLGPSMQALYAGMSTLQHPECLRLAATARTMGCKRWRGTPRYFYNVCDNSSIRSIKLQVEAQHSRQQVPKGESSMQMATIWIFWSSRTGQQRACRPPESCCRGAAPSPCHPSPAQARQASAQQVLCLRGTRL